MMDASPAAKETSMTRMNVTETIDVNGTNVTRPVLWRINPNYNDVAHFMSNDKGTRFHVY
jgi:hypothetical protein